MWIHQKACLHTSVTDTMSYATRDVCHWSVSDVGHIWLQKQWRTTSWHTFFFFPFLWPLFKHQIKGISLSIKIEKKHLHHREIFCCEFKTCEPVCSVFETLVSWMHFCLRWTFNLKYLQQPLRGSQCCLHSLIFFLNSGLVISNLLSKWRKEWACVDAYSTADAFTTTQIVPVCVSQKTPLMSLHQPPLDAPLHQVHSNTSLYANMLRVCGL